jgi:AbiV family abortive infection protein
MTTKRLPTPRQAAVGMRLAAQNAWAHLQCAQTLQEAGYLGAASAHLVYAVEEAVKARVLLKWPALVQRMTEGQLREMLYSHQLRHAVAGVDSMSQALRAEIALWRLDHSGQVPNRAALTRLFVRHPDAFPVTWARNAERERQRGMHVDWDGRSWRSPKDASAFQYERRLNRCQIFVVRTMALAGLLSEIRDDLKRIGWDIDDEA